MLSCIFEIIKIKAIITFGSCDFVSCNSPIVNQGMGKTCSIKVWYLKVISHRKSCAI